MKKLFLSIAFIVIAFSLSAQDITGQWNGVLKVQGIQLKLVFHVQKSENGFTATMDSPDQGAKGIPVNLVMFLNDSIEFSINSIGAKYDGILGKDGIIKGVFSQMGTSFPMDLSRQSVESVKPNRPQEPKPPYPYYSEDVKFVSTIDNDTLAGTLTLPKKNGNFPVVVMITGSGPQNRDEELMGHKPFLVIADYLTRNGIGVLRYDDRGTAQSTGNFKTATSFDFSKDAEAAVNYLLTRRNVNKKKIGLIGHSEGGIIAPMVASRNKNVAYIVLLAGTGVRGDKLLLRQQNAIAQASGIPDELRLVNEKMNAEMFQTIISSPDTINLKINLIKIMRANLNENPVLKDKFTSEQSEELIKQTVNQMISPWMLNFIRYDPYPTLKKVKCPVLALDGSNDLQVPAKENLSAIRKAFQESGNNNLVAIELPGLNHLFQESKSGLPAEYATIEQTFSPKALMEMLTWIKRR